MHETGDLLFRDTVALTVRGDGIDIPPFFILHTYKNASMKSGRRCKSDETPVKGMNNQRMKDYIDHICLFIVEPSLLIMDRLSSLTSKEVLDYIRSKVTKNGEQLIFPLLIPPKTAFLISPLDMGAIAAFKAYFHKLDRHTLSLKKNAVNEAWDAVSNLTLKNICLNCGIVGEETLDSIHSRFMKEVKGLVPEKLQDQQDFYDSWVSGSIEVEGVTRGRGVRLQPPQQLEKGYLDGESWTKFGRRRSSTSKDFQ